MSGFYLPSSTPATPSSLQSPTSSLHNSIYNNLPADPNAYSTYSNGYPSDDDDDDDTALPYPQPLPRTAFLDPDFSPQSYLSTLRNRHQTLEDLRSDLRARVQELSKELVDLVNAEYEDFLSVGSTLRGGEDKVQEVRVGVLGFGREIGGVRDSVRGRKEEVGQLLEAKREVRRDVALGRKLLEVEERLGELEGRLAIEPAAAGRDGHDAGGEEEEDIDDNDDNDDESAGVQVGKLRRLAEMYLQIWHMIDQIGKHPFLDAQEARMVRVRNTLILDLNAALKQSKAAGSAGSGSLLKIVAIYRELGEGAEAVKALRGGKPALS